MGKDYDARHPALKKLRKLATSLPESEEVLTWEHPTFRAGKKIFASFGAHEGMPSIGVKQTKAQQKDWVAQKGFFVPPYVGQHGWIGIWVDQVDWDVVHGLVLDSYRQVALKRMLRALDEG